MEQKIGKKSEKQNIFFHLWLLPFGIEDESFAKKSTVLEIVSFKKKYFL